VIVPVTINGRLSAIAVRDNSDMLTQQQGMQLIADLWMDKFPLTRQHFGKYLGKLVNATQVKTYGGRFIEAALSPDELENRLRNIENTELITSIISEVRNIQDPVELDRRLMDAWAELRTISQLVKEGFVDIQKVTVTADLVAKRQDRDFAFQVKRITTSLEKRVRNSSESGYVDSEPEGYVSDIYARLGEPISQFFWDALEFKNGKFKKWQNPDSTRCIVIVSSDEDLQDAFVRHMACRKITEGLHLLTRINFEELLWLPDTSNGAWFVGNPTLQEVKCLADWCDAPAAPLQQRRGRVNRKEVDLTSDIPAWK
jgi:hypothetical protein